jgi:diacylglycerol O-acyltransferase / wax synthase
MARSRISPADLAWLRMDRTTNQMVVNTVMWFDEPIDWDRLRAVYDERLTAVYPRFRQRPVRDGFPGGSSWWEDDPDFDLERHLRRVRLPTPGDQAALHRYISAELDRPLDRGRPLWESHLIDGYGDGAAVYTRIHHSVTDGIALVRLLLSLTDDRPDDSLAPPMEPDHQPRSRRRHRVATLTAQTVQVSVRLAGEGLTLIARPSRAVELATLASATGRALSKELLLPPDRRTVLKGRMGQHKHVLWADPIPLADVKAIARANEATVNDVLCAAVTGALRTYLEHRDSLVDDVRAFVPVNLRSLDEPLPRDLGNRFGLVFLSLPVGLADRRARLVELKHRMDAIKGSPEGVVAYGVLSAIGLTPLRAEKVIVDVFGSKGSLVLTNVPGPTTPVYLAGTEVTGIMGWVPAAGGIAIGTSIFSYAGKVTVGLYADARLVPDPEALAAAFDQEIAAMLAESAQGT